MALPQNKHYTMEDLEKNYQQVSSLYDMASELVELVEHPQQQQPDAQLSLVAPLIDELTDATDVLAEEFILVAKGARFKVTHTASKTRVESALRRIYIAISDYKTRSTQAAGRVGSQLKQATDLIVDRIHRQVEKVIGIFVEFIQLSLASVMNKNELEELKQRETNVAFMLHQMSQQGSL